MKKLGEFNEDKMELKYCKYKNKSLTPYQITTCSRRECKGSSDGVCDLLAHVQSSPSGTEEELARRHKADEILRSSGLELSTPADIGSLRRTLGV
jgi:hypothetical protein